MRAWTMWTVLAAAAGPLACLPLPARWEAPLEGRVWTEGGRPLPGAVVVVRRTPPHWLPARGSREASTVELRADASGRFALGRRLRPGLLAWPWGAPKGEFVTAWSPGHRCATPTRQPGKGPLRVELARASTPADQLASCPELRGPGLRRYAASRELLAAAAEPGSREPPRWHSTHPQPVDPAAARRQLAPAANCSGPVLDLALDPSRRFVAYQQAERPGVGVWVARADIRESPPARRIGSLSRHPARRLRWEPEGDLAATSEPGSRVWGTPDEETPQLLWRPPIAPAAPEAAPYRPPDPVPLPGEPCSPSPSAPSLERVANGGRFLFDLRWIEGGCRAVRVDLETARWTRVDRSADPGRCRETARITPRELRSVAPGYATQLAAQLAEIRTAPDETFTLWIEPERTRIEIRDWLGALRWLEAPRFPIDTPLRRIEVTRRRDRR